MARELQACTVHHAVFWMQQRGSATISGTAISACSPDGGAPTCRLLRGSQLPPMACLPPPVGRCLFRTPCLSILQARSAPSGKACSKQAACAL